MCASEEIVDKTAVENQRRRSVRKQNIHRHFRKNSETFISCRKMGLWIIQNNGKNYGGGVRLKSQQKGVKNRKTTYQKHIFSG